MAANPSSQAMEGCVTVGDQRSSIEIELEDDGTICLQDVLACYPETKTLKFRCGDKYKSVKVRVS